MTRNLLVLSLLVAGVAGAASADPAPQPESVAVNVTGMSRSAARTALRHAAAEVCGAHALDVTDTTTDCYDLTLSDAMTQLRRIKWSGKTAGLQPRTLAAR